uniref:RST domain-containing protein n=1 Tax=Heterorhabditis bacteriophora TaxID=37862 RepID=A0A1I7WU71_HETBA
MFLAFYAAIVNLKTKATDMLDYESLEKIAVELLRRTRRAIVRQQLIECLTAAVKEKIK